MIKKIIYILVFILIINIVHSSDYFDLYFNDTQIPLTYTHTLYINKSYNTTLTFFTNSTFLNFSSPTIVFNETYNLTNTITISLNQSFTPNTYHTYLFYNDSFLNTTNLILYDIFIYNTTKNLSKFMQVDLETYLFRLYTYETPNYKQVVDVTIKGTGKGYCVCTEWLVCEPYSFDLNNETYIYKINVSTTEAGEGVYYHYADIYLEDETTILEEFNLTFIFIVEFAVEPMPPLNETCFMNNMSLDEYLMCISDYYKLWEERIKLYNRTQNVTEYVYSNETQFKEVVPYSNLNESLFKLTNELSSLYEIDRSLKAERTARKKLEDQIENLSNLNTNLNTKYESAISNIPTMVNEMVSPLTNKLYEEKTKAEALERDSEKWSITKKLALGISVIFSSLFGWIKLKSCFPFWG